MKSILDEYLSYTEAVTLTSPVCDAKEEGKTLMSDVKKYEDTITNVEVDGDDAKKRKYLLEKVGDLWYIGGKSTYLKKLFHVDEDNAPKNYKELIDVIKNDKFKLDEEKTKKIDEAFKPENKDKGDYWSYSAFSGIIWDGPAPDWDGYYKAKQEFEEFREYTKDIINVLPIAAAFDAYQALKDWKPDYAPVTPH